MIERASDGPYIELFARTTAPGWTSWGNEVPRALLAARMSGDRLAVIEAETMVRSVVVLTDYGARLHLEAADAWLTPAAAAQLRDVLTAWLEGKQ